MICFTVVEKFLAIFSFDFIDASLDLDAENFKLCDLGFGEAPFAFFFILISDFNGLVDFSSCPV